jgi:hypothetical protein
MNNTFLKEMVKAKVSFYFNKKIIAEAYYPASASASKAAENFFKNLSSSSNVIMLNKAILSRNNTPWLSINFGKYELIKQ